MYSNGRDCIRESGNVLFLILIAVALFAALSYAVTSSQKNTSAIGEERKSLDKATVANYQAAMQSAKIRLEITNNCRSIDYRPPESQPDGVDKSCFMFHQDGGGVTYQNPSDSCLNDELAKLKLGESCGFMVYVGDGSAGRVYALLNDQGNAIWGPTGVVTSATDTNGKTNTDTLVAYDTSNGTEHPAAQSCRALGSEWYLPSKEELNLFWENKDTIGLSSIGITVSDSQHYWSSNQNDSSYSWAQRFSDGDQTSNGINKNLSRLVRCVRGD